MADSRIDVDPRLIKAIAHPLRHRILLALGEGVASPKAIAGALGEPLGRVSHHVRLLRRIGAIELVETRQRRGAVEHFYRATMQPFFDDATWSRLSPSTRRAFVAQGLGRIVEDLVDASSSRGFDHPRAHLSYTLLELDQAGFDEIADILARLSIGFSPRRRAPRSGWLPVAAPRRRRRSLCCTSSAPVRHRTRDRLDPLVVR